MQNNYSTISQILGKITKNEEIAEKAIELWIDRGNHDSYNRNYLILFGKWAQRELTMHSPETTHAVVLKDSDIIYSFGEDEIINKIARDEKLNEIKQFGTWALAAVTMLEAGFSFGGISRKLKIPKAELIQRLTALAAGKGQLALDFSGGAK